MTIEKTREFRLKQSEEKIGIAKRLFDKGDYGNAIVQAYLSIFYSARVVLLEKGQDSDDSDKIVTLSREYFQPSGWLTMDITALLQKGHTYHAQLKKNCLGTISKEESKQFIDNAVAIQKEIAKRK